MNNRIAAKHRRAPEPDIEALMDAFENDVAHNYPDFDYEKSEDEFACPFYISEASRRMFTAYIAGLRTRDIIETQLENTPHA